MFWNSMWWCWWWCVYLCFDWSKCHDLTWGIEQVLTCMSVTHISYYSDLSCLHGIICYACQVMNNKIMLCKLPLTKQSIVHIHWFFFYCKHYSRQQDSLIFISGFVYQLHSGLDSTQVTTSIISRCYQEWCQIHFRMTMFIDIAETTVPNLIYETLTS